MIYIVDDDDFLELLREKLEPYLTPSEIYVVMDKVQNTFFRFEQVDEDD